MLEYTAKDGPEDASLKHAQSVCILRSSDPRLRSIEDHQTNQWVIYLTFCADLKSSGSQQSMKPIVCTIPMHNTSPDFAADVVVRSNDRPTIAEAVKEPRYCRCQLMHYLPFGTYHRPSLRQAGTSSSSHYPKSNSCSFVFESSQPEPIPTLELIANLYRSCNWYWKHASPATVTEPIRMFELILNQ